VASGSDDHAVKVFDLRKKKLLYSIPAHLHSVTCVKYQVPTCAARPSALISIIADLPMQLSLYFATQPGDGEFLMTASLDKTIKLWYDSYPIDACVHAHVYVWMDDAILISLCRNTRDYSPVKTLQGHNDLILRADLSNGTGSRA